VPLDLKSTINLPKTDFPMKANLPQNEPAALARWEQMGIYRRIREARRGAPSYVLHDGPPYANGPIHMGHALNKCLKDFIVKSKTMAGFDSPYVPGWDCHGLPIEIKVDQQLGGKKLQMQKLEVREACRKYAQKFLDLQREQFRRIGVFGRFGASDGNPNFMHYFYSLGVGGKGVIPSRSNDRYGFGFYYIDVNNPELQGLFRSIKLLRNEYGFEAFYNVAITPWLLLTPDIQVVRGAQKDKFTLSPLPTIVSKKSIGTATILGVRLQMVF